MLKMQSEMLHLQLGSDDGSTLRCNPEPAHGLALVGCGGFATCWRVHCNNAPCVLKAPIVSVERDEVPSGRSFVWPSSQTEHLPRRLRERLQLAVEMASTEGDKLEKIQSHPNIIRLICKVWVRVRFGADAWDVAGRRLSVAGRAANTLRPAAPA